MKETVQEYVQRIQGKLAGQDPLKVQSTTPKKLARLIKGATARQANLILSRTGMRFWQDESFDHWIRNLAESQKIRVYIENNPVAAGLAVRPEEWPWSSASRPIV